MQSPTPGAVFAMPGVRELAANPAYRTLAARDTLHAEWPRVAFQAEEAWRTGVPRELGLCGDGAIRLHIAPVLPTDGGPGGVMVWVHGPGIAASELRDATEHALAAKSRFLAAASHDLRQPFQAMRFFHGVLAAQVDGALDRRPLDMLGRALDSGEQLLDALLDISTLDAGTVQVNVERFPLSDMIERLLDEFRPQIEGRNLVLRSRLRALDACTDPVLLERILRNLLANAVRYTRQGGILVAVRRRQGRARIEIWDTGVGIPDDQVAQIFEEFIQLDNPERDRSRGLGLGLAIVRRLSQLLCAPVTVRSQAGRGSMFGVSVPLPAPDQPARKPARADRPGADLGRRTVLVVDDDAMVLTSLQMLLEAWGLSVLPAEGMAGVLQHLDSQVPDLVLTDLRLRAGLSGFDVIDRVREMLRDDVPAIVLTGETGQAELTEGMTRRVALLHKPIQPEPLHKAISAAVAAAG